MSLMIPWYSLTEGDLFVFGGITFMVESNTPHVEIVITDMETGDMYPPNAPADWTELVELAAPGNTTDELAIIAVRTILGGTVFGEMPRDQVRLPFDQRTWTCPPWETMDGVTRAAHVRVFHGGDHEHHVDTVNVPHVHR